MMGRKHIINGYQLITAQDGTGAITSEPTDCSQVDKITYDVTLTGTIASTAVIEYCNDTRITPQSVWKELDFGEALLMSAATEANYKLDIEVSFRHARFKWAAGSGSGNISVSVFGTTVGA
jgi:hypothetical protein